MFNNTLVLEKIEINIDSQFRMLDGLRILHFSDLHLCQPSKKFEKIFAHLKSIECDLAICSGDAIDNNSGINPCANYLSRLKPRIGTFFTYGNHDKYQFGFKEILFLPVINKFKPNDLNLLMTKLEESGIRVLNNEIVCLDINGIGVELVGIDCPVGYDRFPNSDRFKTEVSKLNSLIRQVSRNNYVILITHIPDLIKEFDTNGIDLILASHTHGGQIRLPFFGPLVSPSLFQKKYSMGIFRYNSCYLHVSSGLGASELTPFRFMCPPKATAITLRSH